MLHLHSKSVVALFSYLALFFVNMYVLFFMVTSRKAHEAKADESLFAFAPSMRGRILVTETFIS